MDNKSAKTDMSSFTVSDVTDEVVKGVAEQIISQGKLDTKYTTKGEQNDITGTVEYYDVGDSYGNYNLITNNCTTFVSDVLSLSGSKVMTKTTSYIENGRPKLVSIPVRPIAPIGLRNLLNEIPPQNTEFEEVFHS